MYLYLLVTVVSEIYHNGVRSLLRTANHSIAQYMAENNTGMRASKFLQAAVSPMFKGELRNAVSC